MVGAARLTFHKLARISNKINRILNPCAMPCNPAIWLVPKALIPPSKNKFNPPPNRSARTYSTPKVPLEKIFRPWAHRSKLEISVERKRTSTPSDRIFVLPGIKKRPRAIPPAPPVRPGRTPPRRQALPAPAQISWMFWLEENVLS